LTADLARPGVLWKHLMCADVAFCHFSIHYFLKEDPFLANFMQNVKQQLKPGARLIVTFLDAAQLEKIVLPFEAMSADDGEVEFSIHNSSNAPGVDIRVCSRFTGVAHEEPLLDATKLTAAFSSHGFQAERVIGFNQLSAATTPALAAELTSEEKILVGLYACAVFRFGAAHHKGATPNSAAPHRLFRPGMTFAVFLEIEEMMSFTRVCRQASELILRRTRLSAHAWIPEFLSCNPVAESSKKIPSVGNYRLPIARDVSNPSKLLSFLFQAFGRPSMSKRSWYTRHVLAVTDIKERGSFRSEASVLWKHFGVTSDSNVTDDAIEQTLSAARRIENEEEARELQSLIAADTGGYHGYYDAMGYGDDYDNYL